MIKYITPSGEFTAPTFDQALKICKKEVELERQKCGISQQLSNPEKIIFLSNKKKWTIYQKPI